mmetsp:Transcript_37317/g.116681  ORF Transcript_37317/g.116681 Transcript_37317/m.116681 type:complete len:288 (-) Transcript_37317:555-1418(-)
MHPELWAALTMLLPSVIAAAMVSKFPAPGMRLARLGCFMHAPWSCMLHTYRALGTSHQVRTWLYKLDVNFIHVHALLQGYAVRGLKHNTIDYTVHGVSMIYMWRSDPLADPSVKMVVNVLVGVACLQSTIHLWRRNRMAWLLSVLFGILAFWIHAAKPLGALSNAYFHALLSVPEYIVLKAIAQLQQHHRGKKEHIEVYLEDEEDEDDEGDEAFAPFIDMDVEGLLHDVMEPLHDVIEPIQEVMEINIDGENAAQRKGLRRRFQSLWRVVTLRRTTLTTNGVGIESM